MPWIFCGSHNTVLGREFRVAKPYIGQCILLMSPYVGCCLWIICLYYFFYCLVNDDLYLLTTWLPVHGLFFMVDCVFLCVCAVALVISLFMIFKINIKIRFFWCNYWYQNSVFLSFGYYWAGSLLTKVRYHELFDFEQMFFFHNSN